MGASSLVDTVLTEWEFDRDVSDIFLGKSYPSSPLTKICLNATTLFVEMMEQGFVKFMGDSDVTPERSKSRASLTEEQLYWLKNVVLIL